jgi:hypothetical protein
MSEHPDTTSEPAIRAWLLDYAWLGTAEERAREVDCIMAQGGWRYLDAQAERLAGQAWEPGPEAVDEATGFALSALYECHDGPHLPTCPRAKDGGGELSSSVTP